jgi:asparagine synthase (glutamine-hydrolysing)
MCGFTGIYYLNSDKIINEETIIRMRDTMVHRGPDDSGLYVSDDKKLGLGFRRLSIIDLSHEANQPLFNEDKNLVLVFNGEIYNYKELKENLISLGHKFRSQTDAEVILHLYEEKKENLLEDLNGMFSFVLYDFKTETIFCCRDRLGIKPFYYYLKDDIFLFGSEIKSILNYDSFHKELNLEAISHYLDFLCVPAPMTLFKNIHKLNAGHYLILTKNDIIIKKY